MSRSYQVPGFPPRSAGSAGPTGVKAALTCRHRAAGLTGRCRRAPVPGDRGGTGPIRVPDLRRWVIRPALEAGGLPTDLPDVRPEAPHASFRGWSKAARDRGVSSRRHHHRCHRHRLLQERGSRRRRRRPRLRSRRGEHVEHVARSASFPWPARPLGAGPSPRGYPRQLQIRTGPVPWTAAAHGLAVVRDRPRPPVTDGTQSIAVCHPVFRVPLLCD